VYNFFVGFMRPLSSHSVSSYETQSNENELDEGLQQQAAADVQDSADSSGIIGFAE